MTQAPHALNRDEGELLWFFGTLIEFKATAEQTGDQFCLLEQLGRSGMATPLHRQPMDAETFYVLEGELRFYLNGAETVVAVPGTTVYAPAGAAHAFEVRSDVARWLVLTTPNHEAFFRAAGQSAAEPALPPDAPPDMARVTAAAEQFGVEILGPPPGGSQPTEH